MDDRSFWRFVRTTGNSQPAALIVSSLLAEAEHRCTDTGQAARFRTMLILPKGAIEQRIYFGGGIPDLPQQLRRIKHPLHAHLSHPPPAAALSGPRRTKPAEGRAK